jgi:shikimate kinase
VVKIYLIGMPGSGKSTLGLKLATELLLPFVDLDKEIEDRERKSIPDIFARNGEEYFRLAESKALHDWAAAQQAFVMATGGGAPCFHNGIDIINQTGISIFLNVPVRELLARTENHAHRPLLNADDRQQKEEKLTTLLNKRLPCYSRAAITVDSPDLTRVLHAIRIHTR